ncbi:MAG: N-acetylglucosamine-6-phosphate deacetylase [Rhodobacteraceae bacterium]|jgi:N-acetylglucosamine-6-phosphate deacetylase|nr:N-acetylglucosamine-6-phosphate deacetylase [Paracoccaceae bacterium]
MIRVWRARRIFDGQMLRDDCAVLTDGARIVDVIAAGAAPGAAPVTDLGDAILGPGFLDLQVNGGGGAMLGQGDPDAALATLCAAHGRLGSTGILPTLITSDSAVMMAVLDAGRRAAQAALPGFLGLHLEGPFLDPARKGAHDPGLIRALTDADLAALIDAAHDLPTLMVTLAPENASLDQIAALAAAGVIVSLGHSGTVEATARRAFDAGATCVTHLFNAMSPLGHRAPGLVGAALDAPVWAGIIADGEHVAATALRVALSAKPGRVFAVSDAMAVAGTDLTGFTLNGRRISRHDGRLTLEDGTLAGADTSLPQSLRWMVQGAGVPLETALAMTTAIPARVLDLPDRGRIAPGAPADFVCLDTDLQLCGVWREGQPVR